ncbi:heat shock factor protein 1 isoform X2 [Folsomia candida]|uniref:heat shock factor protein 1 isoform X2 n=1 Tax=Folsomia candida TaxID=158441 RepID=UPI000B8FDE43|nr:heat shock factor protein 1 isoform X2 [Folsomia candida]
MHTLVEMNAGNGGGQGAHVPAFLAKLWKLVDDPVTNDLIYWSEPGNSFVIRNQAKFSRELLPLYYKHNNMASFVRQLNMYGFHKVVSVEQGGLKLEKDEMEFAHPFFLRGNEASLELIKRKIPAPKHDDTRRPDNFQKVLLDVRQMKGRQENMDTKLLTIKRENEALWRELATLRQKHANQTTILSKILQFLVGVMSSRNHRLGFKRRSMPLMLNDTDETKPKTRRRNEVEGQVQVQTASGPVIHDVTELFEDSDGGVGEDYDSGGEGCNPQVDSPLAPESILGLASNHLETAAAELLSADPNGRQRTNRSLQAVPSSSSSSSAGKEKVSRKRVPQTPTTSVVEMSKPTSVAQPNHQVAIEESEENSGDGFLEPTGETTYYITGANGEPLKVCLTIPEVTTTQGSHDLVLPIATTTSSGNMPVGMELMVTPQQQQQQFVEPTASATASRNMSPQYNLKRNNTIAKKEDLDAHLDDMQLGLDNLRDILKSDEYKMDTSTLLGVSSWPSGASSLSDPLLQLFGDGELNLDFSKLNDGNDGGVGTSSSSSGQELVSYNPSLFELTEDDSHFFDDSSNMFLDDELQSMLTTDREKLKQSTTQEKQGFSSSSNLSTNGEDIANNVVVAHGSQIIRNNSGLTTPTTSSSPTVLQPQTPSPAVPTGAGRRKRK